MKSYEKYEDQANSKYRVKNTFYHFYRLLFA